MRTWRSRARALPAPALFAAALAASPVSAFARPDDEEPVLPMETIEDLDEQLDRAGADTSGPNTELWEEYKRYRRGRDGYRRSTERVEIGGSIVVRENELIEGDVVSVGGSVEVNGRVEGDCVAIGGNLVLHDGAYIAGDAVAIGGQLQEFGDAEVAGERVSIAVPFDLPFGSWSFETGGLHLVPRRHMELAFSLAWYVAVLLVSLLLYALAGRRLDVVSRRIDAEPGQSFLMGLLGAFATPFALIVALVLLIVTLIGILLVPVLLIVLVVLVAAGFVAACLTVGRRIVAARAGADQLAPARSPFLHLVVGFVALHALCFLSDLMGFWAVGFLQPFALLFGVLGVFVVVFAAILGYGALMTSRFGTQPALAGAAPGGAPPLPGGGAPAPPPPPPGPPPPEPPRTAPPPPADPGRV